MIYRVQLEVSRVGRAVIKEEKVMSEVLSIDIGGSHVKVRIPSDPEKRRFTSGPDLTPQQMVDGVKTCIEGWDIDRVSIGIPAPIRKNTAVIDPVNLGSGWAGFDFSDAFGFPTRVTNDAAMQAIGSYEGGSMLFMGLGTGLGTCLINQYVVQPTEIAHMPYRHGHTFEDAVGEAGLEKVGKKAWRQEVCKIAEILYHGLLPDYIVLGGGNSKKFKADDQVPEFCRRGDNADAFEGGFRMWLPEWERTSS